MAMTQKEEGHTHHQREIVALLAVGAPYCPAESIVGSSVDYDGSSLGYGGNSELSGGSGTCLAQQLDCENSGDKIKGPTSYLWASIITRHSVKDLLFRWQ